jgi:hypothetical protein
MAKLLLPQKKMLREEYWQCGGLTDEANESMIIGG